MALGAAAESPVIVLPGRPAPAVLPGEYSIFRDPSGKLAIQDVLAAPARERFLPNRTASPSFGYSSDVFWLRLQLRNGASEAVRAIVELRATRFEKLDWFAVREGRVAETEAAGNLRPRGALKLATRLPAFAVDLRPGEEAAVYLRAETETLIMFPLAVHAGFESFASALVRGEAAGFAFGGLAATILCLSLLLGVLLRRRLFFVNALCALALSLYFAILSGYWTWLGLPLGTWLVRQPVLSLGVVLALGVVLFTREFFRDSLRGTRAGRGLDLALPVLLGVAVGVLFLPYQVGNHLVSACTLGVMLGCLAVAGWQFFFRKQPGTRLVLAAWLLDVLILLVLQLQWHGWLPVWLPPAIGLMCFFTATSILFLGACMDQLHLLLQGQVRAQKLERSQAEGRLRLLRYQLNPHFLFNSLNSAIGLVQEDPARGASFLFRFARFLRASLHESSDATVPLSEEVEIVQAYLGIEKVRFEDLLEVSLDIPEAVQHCHIPERSLLPLVENAVRHGMRPAPFVLHIRIRAWREAEALHLEVANTGSLAGSQSSGPRKAGIGLRNLRERLELVCHRRECLTLTEEGGWVAARIRLPFPSRPPGLPDLPDLPEPGQPLRQTKD